MNALKNVWRRLRMTQPFNKAATSLGRMLVACGVSSNFFVEHLPYRGRFSLPLPGELSLQLQSHGDDYIVNQTFWTRTYEAETTPVFFALARKARCTLDIGAHVGYYALLAGRANPLGQVFAFEPVPAIFGRLEENVSLNDLANVRPVQTAVGDHDGTVDLYYADTPGVHSNATLLKKLRDDRNDRYITVPVPLTRLDTFIKRNQVGRVDLIKMDTEGTEQAVLEGLGDILERDRPIIICEVLAGIGDGAALANRLKPLGYRFYVLQPEGPRESAQIVGDSRWWNYLLSPKPLSDLEIG
jgi:FkbM family methyltransferase